MNNKILGIIGSALLILALFLPAVSFAGIISFSAFDGITHAPINQSWLAIVVGLCGVIGLFLAATNKTRLLVAPGIIALGLVVLFFVKFKSEMSNAGATAGGDEATQQLASQMADAVSIGFGVYVAALAALIMIVASFMKSATPTANPNWGAPPPPYPPAR